MRKLISVLAVVLLTLNLFAQAPDKMSYQAVIRNSNDVLVSNTQIGIEINIIQGSPSGTVVYTETLTPYTNANGLVSIEIGGGAGFNTINWTNGPFFIETKTAVVPPLTNYTITGTSQLLSVPYALHASTADTVLGAIAETDPLFTAWDKDYSDLINTPSIINSQWTTSGTNIYYNSGYVGIGNDSPTNGLHVTTSGNGNESKTFALKLENDDFGLTTTGLAFSVEGGSNNYAKAGIAFERTSTWARGKLHFLVSNAESTNEVQVSESVMTINHDGNVGIGTTNPTSKLSVAGGDVYVTDVNSGIIITSPNGSCWRITVNNAGSVITTSIACP